MSMYDNRKTNSNINSDDPESLKCRVFIGSLNTDRMQQSDLRDMFEKYGPVKGKEIL